MKQTLQLKVSQQLTLTPQLQQSIKLLQMSTLDLQTEVERFLLDNPLLERGDEAPQGEAPDAPAGQEQDAAAEARDEASGDDGERGAEAGELSDWGSGGRRGDGDDELDPMLNVPCPISLREHLLAQLGEVALPTRDQAIVQLLIEELDDDGYLGQTLEDIASHLPLELEIEADELMIGLRLLQQFDPPGVGARSLPEALALQLQRLDPDEPQRELALAIVRDHLALLGNRDYTRLKKQLGVDDAALRAAQALIARLNPRPTAGFGANDTQYVIPDISVRKRKGRWVATLNGGAVPRLRVNQMYARLLAENRGGNGEMSSRLQEAKWLVKNIQQRFDTILKVAEAIVERQQSFFEHGEVAMRPLILRDIADELGLHESTVSRVTTQKYLLCPRGLFELKYFFGSALETDSGGECSATAIKAHIRSLIDAESPSKPLSDSALVEALAKQGIQVARRTIAKYREAMQIPPVNQRKTL
ncbi:RNA polymerase sigma-54 factor [Chromobacterium alkanivorans]|uniref:RNA polymerase factor sigma-54 n=1 Tax=Chromobacterium alkanivorans TaxID=1071719 RepID=UPI002166DE16|nr:RNA polymerase factor sigma-54 [Chromobacterium alkanivorans]MCS3804925.1 RNA polymerase sigma-54 factor [Chromobacterium alkanivorans]MCS3819512.1 RNA polymerase sigma-54 factor [Chromobacterium alkanivorans]MCS3874024.1 RNA polymerase sigma-54 factor [Chromobacterium alkanivorans]